MRFLKVIFSFLFFSLLVSGKAALPVAVPGSKILLKEQRPDLKTAKTFYESQKDEASFLKRKNRPRGIEVIVPHISDSSFEQECIYKEYKFPTTNNSFSLFLYYLPDERGPPLAV